MKNALIVIILGILVVGTYFFINKKEPVVEVPVVSVTEETKPVELCFGGFGKANTRGLSDKNTLYMSIDNTTGKVTGELKFLPAEKDSKVGKFEGTVSVVDKVMMARTVDATWDTFAEGINAKEQLKFIFGEGTASIGLGEMVERGDGVYVYKDEKNILYNLELGDVACTDLTLRDNIESYLKANIAQLSPVKAVLGGTWQIIGVTSDLKSNSGVVVYEDGHIQEIKNFTFTANEKQEVVSLTILK